MSTEVMVQELESLVQTYYNPEPTDESGGDKRAMLPADVQLLDRCADAAQRLLSDATYSADEVSAACSLLFSPG